MNYQYKTLPFDAQLKSCVLSTKGVAVEAQLLSAITANAIDGFEYYRMETVHITAKAGCFGSIFGAKDYTAYMDILVFRKPI